MTDGDGFTAGYQFTAAYEPLSVVAGARPSAKEEARRGDATRYLCVAAHVDADFNRTVLQELLFSTHRAVAPSYGIDVEPVIRHGLAARRRRLIRDAAVTGLLLVFFIIWRTGTVSFCATLLAVLCAVRAIRAVRRRDLARAFAYAVGAVLAWSVASLFGFLGAMQAIAPEIPSAWGSPYGGSPDAASAFAGQIVGLWLVLPVCLWAILAAEKLLTHHVLVNHLSAGRYSPDRAPTAPEAWKDRLAYLEAAQWGNLTVFSERAVRPLVGSGWLVGDSSLAVPLNESRRDESGVRGEAVAGSAPVAIGPASTGHPDAGRLTTAGLYEDIRKAVVALKTDASLAENERIRGLSLKDRVFCSGLLPPDHPFLDRRQARPLGQLAAAEVDRARVAERGPVRHYLTVRTASWQGEVEATLFVYVRVAGRMLYVELMRTALPPIRAGFHLVDSFSRFTPGVVVRALASSFVEVLAAPAIPVSLAGAGIERIKLALARRDEDVAIRDHLAFDYGARTSVRELGGGTAGLFHEADAARHLNLVERKVIDTIADVLERHGYDTSDFRQRAATVIDRSINITDSTLIDSAVASSRGRATAGGGGAPSAPSKPSP